MKLTKQPLLPGFENGLYERRPVFDKAELEAGSTQPQRNPARRGNHVNVRLSTQDLEHLHQLSLHEGVPVPSLIAGIVRKYLTVNAAEAQTLQTMAGTGIKDRAENL